MAERLKRVPLNVSIHPDLAARLERESESRMLGKVWFVEKALTQYLDQLDNNATGVERAIPE